MNANIQSQDIYPNINKKAVDIISCCPSIHRDGATRCGLLCAASYLLEHMKVEQEVDVFHTVQHIRSSRLQLVTDLVGLSP